jgi:hypothetical protein
MAVVVTSKGREFISNRVGAGSGSFTEPKFIGWGTGGVAGGPFTAAVTDVAPFQESAEARTPSPTSSIVTTTTTNDTYQVVGTITATATRAIAEVFLVDSTTKSFSTTWSTAPTTTSGTSGTTAASYTPANNTYIQCRGEVMKVTAGTGTTSVTVQRGQNGSTAVTQSAGDAVTAGNIPGTSDANSTNMFLHADHGVLNLANGDSVQYTIKVSFS